jgi:hypothetical protein
MLIEGLIVVSIALVITVFVLYYAKGTSVYKGPSAIYDLKTPNTMVLPSNELPWGAGPCAIRFGIFVDRAPKTVSKVDCQDFASSVPVTKLVPSCNDYSYKPCECNASDCTRCKLDESSTSYLFKLLNLGDNLELWASGYTNQNDKPYIPALLKIKTAKSSNEHYMETISLPAIPLQRWTIVTIVKEGRRFDIYYGSKPAASKMLNYVPVSPDGSRNWFAGNSNWQGKVGFFLPINGSWGKESVEKDINDLVNTRGVPYYLDQLKLDFKMPETSCIFGNCNQMPAVKPANPFAVWDSKVS